MGPWRISVFSVACALTLWPGGVRASQVELTPLPPPGPLPELVYSIETDKQVYQLWEEVYITHRAVNQGEVDIWLEFLCSPACQFYILAGDERIQPCQILCQVIWGFTLSPGESYGSEWTWDMTDRDGSPLAPGNYDIVGIAHGGPSRPLVIGAHYPQEAPVTTITVVPEPGMLATSLLSFGVLLRGRRREHGPGALLRGAGSPRGGKEALGD